MAPRVYIANFAGHDYDKAEKFGELKFITQGFVSFQSLERVKFQVAQGLVDTTPEDYLVLSGANIINVIAAILWFAMHGQVKTLNYDKMTDEYREITLTSESVSKFMEQMRSA